MKIIMISDVHGDYESLEQLKQYISEKGDIDLILIVGDICSKKELIDPLLKNIGVPIYYILGNDDNPQDKYYFGEDIDLKIIEIKGVNIIGCGGAPKSELDCPYEFDENERYTSLKKLFDECKKPIIFLSHSPPKGVLDLASRWGIKNIGSKAVRKIIEEYQPFICICGHVHKQGGKKGNIEGKNTLILNVAPFGDEPEIDTIRGKRFAIIEIINGILKSWHFEYLVDSSISLEKFIDRYV